MVSGVVDRFLAAKRGAVGSPAQTDEGDPAAPQPISTATPAAASPPIADFVCENDVREAMRYSRKIYVGPKTIITPSAREFGDQFGILVLAQR